MIKPIFFTPGPSELYFTVPDHIRTAIRTGIPSISHRGGAFKKLYEETVIGLKELLQIPEGYHIVFTASATEIWFLSALNIIEKKSLHAVNGAFSSKFEQIVSSMGINTQVIEKQDGQGFYAEDIQMEETETEFIALTLNETSTGAALPANEIDQLRKKFPQQLISLDVVSAAPAVPVNYHSIDSFYFSVQKAFGLPAGLGVWVYNERVLEKHSQLREKRNIPVSKDLLSLHRLSQNNQTMETPNTLNIYLLNHIVQDMLAKGKQTIERETIYKSSLLYHALDKHPLFAPFVTDTKVRSLTTIVAGTENVNNYIKKLEHHKFIVGSGYGKYKTEHIRIANFPTHSKEQFELLVDTIDTIQ